MNYFLRNAINLFLQLEQKREESSGQVLGKKAGKFTTEYIRWMSNEKPGHVRASNPYQ